VPTTISAESLARRIRHARANIRHAEQLQDQMDAAAWRALMDARHEALNELIDKAQENT
jgi:class 3 adenylate cyclase